MQPEIQTNFLMITNQQENTAICSTADSFNGNTNIKSEDKCFLGMLNDIEKIPHEKVLDVENWQENGQNNEGLAGMVIKSEPETSFLMGDMALKEEHISEILLGAEQNSKGNEEKLLIPVSGGNNFLKGYDHGNGKDKNAIAIASKVDAESNISKSTPSDGLNITVQTEESEFNAWPKELNKNSTEIHISKGFEGKVGNEAKVQSLKGLEADIAKIIKEAEKTGKNTDAQIKHAADIKDAEKTAITDRIVMEGSALRANVEESKVLDRSHLFNDEIKESELSKKELLLKLFTGMREKERDSDLLKRDNTSDKKTSQADQEVVKHKEAGLSVKSSANESLVSKVTGMESEGKGNGILTAKNVSGDKSFEEILFAKENRPSSNFSRTDALNQIVQKAALSLKDGKSHARLELKPEFLGSVRMKITTENHLVRVRILTELPMVKEMIENNISQLKTDLQNHGLSIDKLDVSVANDSQQHGKGFEKAELLSENENSDNSDNATLVAEETETVNLLKEEATEDGLDFFA